MRSSNELIFKGRITGIGTEIIITPTICIYIINSSIVPVIKPVIRAPVILTSPDPVAILTEDFDTRDDNTKA